MLCKRETNVTCRQERCGVAVRGTRLGLEKSSVFLSYTEVRMVMGLRNLLCETRQNLVNYLFCKQCILRDEIKGDYSVIWFCLPQSWPPER